MRHLSLLLLFFPVILFAQKTRIEGTIQDANTQKPLTGAVISIGETGLGAVSDAAGHFSVSQIPVGTHAISIALPGYTIFTKNVEAAAGQANKITCALQSGAVNLEEITIKSYTAHHTQAIGQLDIRLRPLVNSQELLRMVPGLFMGQHAGGGKAEQIFLRGFDIDHGTDIRLTVDGMPVNMVSHAHGQGYADLHFVIPELVERVQFEKGPYHADKGNFATAGWVDFQTREVLERNFAKLEAGQYGTGRGVAAVNLLGRRALDRQQSAYLAGEYSYSDSYFDAPQFFNRANVQGRYAGQIGPNTRLSLTGSHFWSRWNHSGQIPDRAVESGQVSFFGSIDPTEGGETSRSNANAQFYTLLGRGAMLKNQFFYSNYQFELYSNFTFFLEDSINGDQIRQKEQRNLFGYNGSYSIPGKIGGLPARSSAGVQFRMDAANDVELSNTRNRTITEQNIQLGDIREANLGLYAEQDIQLSRRFSLNVGLRYDFFTNRYTNQLENNRRESARAGLLLPRINLRYTPNDRFQAYLNSGRGFHSNDTRVAVPQNGREVLPPAYGTDLGVALKPIPRLYVNAALWYLWLDQEFVYVGDAGVVEAGGSTRRYGLEASARYQLTRRLFVDIDANYTHSRALSEPQGANLIPLAPIFTTVGGLSLVGPKGFNGSLRYRYLANRPANEDNSITAEGYFVPDLQLNYTRKNWEIGLNIQNLSNTRWKETQFATETRLQQEAEPVEEIHFTPGTPFFMRASFTYFF